MAVVRVLSIGICIAVLVFVIGVSGVAWYISQQKTVLFTMLLLLHGRNKWQHN